jgi:hypothetical protein
VCKLVRNLLTQQLRVSAMMCYALQVLKALADPAHTYSKYSTGNIGTLRDDVPEGMDTRTELLKFHDVCFVIISVLMTYVQQCSLLCSACTDASAIATSAACIIHVLSVLDA